MHILFLMEKKCLGSVSLYCRFFQLHVQGEDQYVVLNQYHFEKEFYLSCYSKFIFKFCAKLQNKNNILLKFCVFYRILDDYY